MTTEKKQRLEDAIREMRRRYHDAIAAEIKNSTKTYSQIAAEHGTSEQTVYQIARIRGLCRSSRQSDTEQVNPSETSFNGGNHGQL